MGSEETANADRGEGINGESTEVVHEGEGLEGEGQW